MTLPDARFLEVATILAERTGLRLSEGRAASLQAAIRSAMARSGERDVATYIARLHTGGRSLDDLIAEAVIGETYFFRDPAQFDVLRERIIPQLLQDRPAGVPLTLWSAACASGEEAYSLAILMETLGLGERTRIIATDVSRAAIETAERGAYRDWSFRGGDGPWSERWFTSRGKLRQIAPRLRSRVHFAVHSLTHPATLPVQPPGFDIVVCRNVLIYFDAATVARVVRTLAGALAPAGWLLTAPSDPLLPTDIGVERVTTPAGIVYRRPAIPIAPVVPQSATHTATLQPPREERRREPEPEAECAATRIRALIERGDRSGASTAVEAAVLLEPLDAELHILRSFLLLDLGRAAEAVVAARRAIFLDRSLAIAHLLLARALRLDGRPEPARRALRCCTALIAGRPGEESVPFAGGTSTASLAAISLAERDLLDQARGFVSQ